MELAQDRVQWRAIVLAVLNLRVLPPASYLLHSWKLGHVITVQAVRVIDRPRLCLVTLLVNKTI